MAKKLKIDAVAKCAFGIWVLATWLVLATRCCKRSLEKLILIDRFGAASSFGIQRQVELSGVTGLRQEPEREPGTPAVRATCMRASQKGAACLCGLCS